jgi:hypothetical protein
LPQALARVTPREELVTAMPRLLYQALFALTPGKGKAEFKTAIAAIGSTAGKWLQAFPDARGFQGVIAAALAKSSTPEELCAHVAEYVDAIDDVRVLRLLLRERLADVSDPAQRLHLFEQAIAKIPPLDGIAQDHLQLVHLVAKRAAAEGDLAAARAAWLRCAERDPDNPGVVQNLMHLARARGDEAEATKLGARLSELWEIYVAFGPRPDIILARAAARLGLELALALKHAREDETPPAPPAAEALVLLFMHQFALARLAVDEKARKTMSRDELRLLVRWGAPHAESASVASRVLSLPFEESLPIAYGWFDCAKDASLGVLEKARDTWREAMRRQIESVEPTQINPEALNKQLDLGERETQVLFDPVRRAAYDAATCDTDLAEWGRLFFFEYLKLVGACARMDSKDIDARRVVANRLWALLTPVILEQAPQLPGGGGELALRERVWNTAFIPIIARSTALMEEAKFREAVDVLEPYVELGKKYSFLQLMYVRALLADLRLPPSAAVAKAKRHAELTLATMPPSDPVTVRMEMNRVIETPELQIQLSAAVHSQQLDEKKDHLGSLTVLASVHPQSDASKIAAIRTMRPPGTAFRLLPPAGLGRYSARIAFALLTSTAHWWQHEPAHSAFDLDRQRRAAKAVIGTARAWANHAIAVVGNDPIAAITIAQVRESLSQFHDHCNRFEAAMDKQG